MFRFVCKFCICFTSCFPIYGWNIAEKPYTINQLINPIIFIDNDYTLPVELKVKDDLEIGVVIAADNLLA